MPAHAQHSLGPQPVPMLTIEQVFACRGRCVIDLRSPEEFAQDHLPGAVNLPLFGDLQRAMVGYLYRQVSADAALERGQRYAQERVQALVQAIGRATGWTPPEGRYEEFVSELCSGDLAGMESLLQSGPVQALPERPVVLHCWRGGLRSRSVVALVRALGLSRAVGLQGGYKAYRHQVLQRLATWKRPNPVVLHGLTGVGKTLVLREIEALEPGRTLDLEALAGHRSSLLGMVGLEPCGQKEFDSRLARALQHAAPGPLVVEGESRKVGDVVVPAGLWQAMRAGTPVWLQADMPRRIEVLLADYLGPEHQREPLRRQLRALVPMLPKDVDWLGLFDCGQEPELVRQLLERHYDPLYRRSVERHLGGRLHALDLPTFDTESPGRTAREILDWMHAQRGPADGSQEPRQGGLHPPHPRAHTSLPTASSGPFLGDS